MIDFAIGNRCYGLAFGAWGKLEHVNQHWIGSLNELRADSIATISIATISIATISIATIVVIRAARLERDHVRTEPVGREVLALDAAVPLV